ncbi:hypothetical protein EHW97_11970 [Aeromicrobium camelliae]|uniref:DUF6919 domain-containing protein n=1 Tax=Aeromicrobium camelliae TaxID=1538144 RepID=A0A3N6WCH4_9ACTN|nr:hypothetical protein [Aeromicrobium camelliae]RQN02752.1 hypothetical protein EHW97_11970 [Aeromicrobium camelliae]
MTIGGLDEPWNVARSLDDLAAATIDFLEGRLQETPLHGGLPNPESLPLIPTLVAMNRAGFVTTDSQPGSINEPTRRVQRAYVEGICHEATAARIERGLLTEDLVMVSFAPGSDVDSSIVVTVSHGSPCTFLGRWSVEELDHFRNGLASLDADLDAAWAIQIFDPQWARNDRLWTAVLRALTTD